MSVTTGEHMLSPRCKTKTTKQTKWPRPCAYTTMTATTTMTKTTTTITTTSNVAATLLLCTWCCAILLTSRTRCAPCPLASTSKLLEVPLQQSVALMLCLGAHIPGRMLYHMCKRNRSLIRGHHPGPQPHHHPPPPPHRGLRCHCSPRGSCSRPWR